jgi:glutathione S-transferase
VRVNVPSLVIGNKNYSSWSLRPWLALKVLGVEFQELRIPLGQPGSKQAILTHSPSGRLPCLVDGEIRVWDSLAILEYTAEQHPQLWPEARAARAHARAVSAEMHSSFAPLRQNMPMDARSRHPGKGRTPEVLADIARIQQIWEECRARFGAGGPFLFGRFSGADAMYAPVVLRFATYEVELSAVNRAYTEAVRALPALAQWVRDAERETETIAY